MVTWNDGEKNNGVWHIQDDCPTYQFTIEDHSEYSETGPSFHAKMFRTNFSGTRTERTFSSLKEAQEWLEGLFQKLMADIL